MTIQAIIALLAVALLRLFAQYLPIELAQQLATGVADEIVGTVLVLLGGVAVYGRARVGRQTTRPGPRVLFVLVVALGLAGCAATWPSTCIRTDGGGRECRCSPYRIVRVSPDGVVPRRVVQRCGDEPMPIVVLADEVTPTGRGAR